MKCVGVRGCAGLLPSLLPSDGSAQVRLFALFQEVLEPESLGVVYRQLLDLFRRHEPELGGLAGVVTMTAPTPDADGHTGRTFADSDG